MTALSFVLNSIFVLAMAQGLWVTAQEMTAGYLVYTGGEIVLTTERGEV
jgi:hypothetical protein